jgi:hypothetical protein
MGHGLRRDSGSKIDGFEPSMDVLGQPLGFAALRPQSVQTRRMALVPIGRLLVGPADAQRRGLVVTAADDR